MLKSKTKFTHAKIELISMDILKTYKVQIERKMKNDVKIQVLKYFLNLFNGIFLIIGAIILGCGIWILWDENSFISTLFPADDQDNVLSIAAYCFLVIGITVTVVSLVGCIGSIKEVKCLFILYFLLMILIFVLQLAIELAVLIQYDTIVTVMDEKTIEAIEQYGNSNFSNWNLLDIIQREFQCCGYYNSTDWEANELIVSTKTLPCSCSNFTVPYTTSLCTVTESSYIYPQGCSTAIKKWLDNSIFGILGTAIALLLIQILQFIMGVSLLKSIKKRNEI
uniref:CD82 antigen-like n=1 Tax=Pristiophorus japonicus TaxID=55135 RepID=UPI00398E4917